MQQQHQALKMFVYDWTYIVEFVCGLTASVFVLSSSIAYGWTSPMLPKLQGYAGPMHLTSSQGSYLVSLMQIGGFCSPIPVAWAMDNYGRKITILVSSLPLIVGWLLLSQTQSLPLWYLSRFLSGLSNGAAYTVIPIYLGEISSPSIRGCISIIFTVFSKLGILLAYLITPEVTMSTMSNMCICLVGIFFATFIWMPETPQFLLSKGNATEAHRSLNVLRRHSETVANEFNQMRGSINSSSVPMFGLFKQLIRNKASRNALLLMLAIGAQLQFSGSQAIVCNSKMILGHFASDGFSTNLANILLGCVQVLSAMVASFVVDYFGRRTLLLSGVVVTGFCNAVISAYFLAIRMEFDVLALGWIPMLMVFIFIVFYTIGLASVCTLLVGEIFAKNVRAVASAVSTMNATMLSAVVTKLFQVFCDKLGQDTTFFMFFVCSMVAFWHLWRVMPETKGKQLDDIQKEFN